MSGNHVSINIFDLIDSICSAFRQQWKAGKQPRIEDYLLKVPEVAREQLFRNLLTLDIRYRQRAGDPPTPTDYLDRFPELKKAIADAFHYSTSISMEGAKDTPADESAHPTITYEAPAANRIGNYELIRELGRGGFGVVYHARHCTRGDHVALKTLPTGNDGQEINAERLHNFRREFRSLSQINHPNLVGMQSLEVDGSQWFFTMDLVRGVDFLSYVRPAGALDEERLRAVLPQLVDGISALHEQRILHRDLKPSNVLVTQDGRVSILDFGLIAELEQATDQTASMQTRNFAGTPKYAAPEQVFGMRCPATDWYALGTMLYETLIGEAPFRGTASEVLIKKQQEDAPRLSGRADLPADLTNLVDRLLEHEPENRPDARAIRSALGIADETVVLDSSQSTVASVTGTADVLLIGRESQLAQLEEARQELLRTHMPSVVFISGRSGEGKTSLADKFLSKLRLDGKMLVLAGRCYDRESVPFKAIDCWIDALVTYLRRLGTEEIADLLPQDIGMLARLFPVLRRVSAIDAFAGNSNINVDNRQARYQGFAALKELLASIGRRTPVVLFIDDVQWGDADSATALYEILKPPDSPAMLLLCSYRSDEAGDSPFLCDWRARQCDTNRLLHERQVQVGPLSEEQCLQLATTRLGIPIEALRTQLGKVHEGTHGNPYFVEQLLEGFDAQAGAFRIVPLDEIIDRKLARLPEGAKPLLEAIAIAGQAVTLAEAHAVCEQDMNAFSVATHMRSERLVRSIGGGDGQQIDTYHDKIREAVLARLPPQRRRDLHVRFAQWLEQQEKLSIHVVVECLQRNAHSARSRGIESERIFDIAHHYSEAGHEHAFAYQLLAGITSLISYAGDEALAFLQRAAELVPEQTDVALRYLLWISMGRACLICKRSEQACEYLERALEFASTDIQQAMAHMGLATADRFAGRFRQATGRYDLALQLIGAPRPRTKLKQLMSMARDNLFAVMAGSPKLFRDPNQVQESDSSLLQYSALREVGALLIETDMLGFLACASKACRMSVAHGTALSLIAGYEWGAGFFSAAGLFPIARIYHGRAEHIEKSVADPKVSERRLFYYFAYDYFKGDLVRAEKWHVLSWQTAKRLGEHNEAVYRPHMLRHIATYIHSTSVELQWAHTTLQAAKELGSEQQVCWGTYDVGVAQARRGNLAAARQKMQESLQLLRSEPHYMTESIRGASLGFICLQCSDYEHAAEMAGKAWRNAVKNLILIDVSAYALPIYMESLAGPRWHEGIGRNELRQLRRLSWWSTALFRTLPNQQPHLLRMLGRYYAGRGRLRKATKQFRKSIENARARGMEYAAARALLDLAALSPQSANTMRREAVALLKKTESVIPYAERWQLGDQYDNAVVAPQFNTQVWQRENDRLADPALPVQTINSIAPVLHHEDRGVR